MGDVGLRAAIESAGEVCSKVPADRLGDPTPCASWNVATLVNHMVARQTFFAVTAETGSAPGAVPSVDVTEGDFAQSFATACERTIVAFGAEGLMEQTMRLRYGQVSGRELATIAAIDTLTHGWDLARATGQAIGIDAGVAAELLRGARSLLSGMRGAEGEAPYGVPVDVAESSAPVDRLAAYLGRHP